jgi:prolyl-tRNA synthetase
VRLSKLFGKTLREAPADAETVSHQLLVRSGMIQQVAAGVYSYLPLAWRVVGKIESIIRQEMEAAGGQELHMPVLQPYEIWQESGRDVAFGKGLFCLRDRRDRFLVLGPTHEEIVTDLARRFVNSYRDLPLMLYQIQTKFRDEPRPRGGLVRVREFTMKDLYSFDANEAGLEASYRRMIQAYKNVYARCGLETVVVQADSGAIGGKDSHEFMVVAQSGEDEIILCTRDECYAANVEKATSLKPELPKEPHLPVEEVSTPGMKTIDEVATFLGVPKSKTLKAVFYAADGEVVFATIRGDLEVNEIKLKNALKVSDLRLATDAEVVEAGLVAGSASAVGLRGMRVIADDSIQLGQNFVVGANKPDTHLVNANYPRDLSMDIVTDIAMAKAGDLCPRCGSELRSTRGIEVGHVFKLGTVFSEKQGANYVDSEGNASPMHMGCYGMGIGRLLAAAIEQNHDDKGIMWPMPIAPYDVFLCALGMDDPEVRDLAEELYESLQRTGVQVLLDDRIESPGVKFNDADLLGMPIRLVVSRRGLKTGSVEIKQRNEGEAQMIPSGDAVTRVRAMIRSTGVTGDDRSTG